MIIVIIISYAYIFISMHMRQRSLQDGSRHRAQRNMRYRVPLLIVVSFIAFYIIPELMLFFGFQSSIWFYLVWCLNYVCDPLVYMFGSAVIRGRVVRFLKRVFRKDVSELRKRSQDQTAVSAVP